MARFRKWKWHRALLSRFSGKKKERTTDESPRQKSRTVEAGSFLDRLREAPSPAFYLGIAGLLPFIGSALFCLTVIRSYRPMLASIQMAYGASVLSFMGGVHWGYSLRDEASPTSWWNLLCHIVIPLLVTWGGGPLLLMIGFSIAWHRDAMFKKMPPWLGALRKCLQVSAILSLGLTYIMDV